MAVQFPFFTSDLLPHTGMAKGGSMASAYYTLT